MILHYIKVAFRNLAKYKVQTLISVLSMAVGVMVFTVVWSVISQLNTSTLLENPKRDNICVLTVYDLTIQESQNIANNGLKCAEKVFATWEKEDVWPYFPIYEGENIVGQKRDRLSLVSEGFMEFYGCKSALTGETISTPKHNEIVVSDRFAMEHFGTIDVRGREIVSDNYAYRELTYRNRYTITPNENNVTLRISDVIHKPTWTDECIDGYEIFMLNETPYQNGTFLIIELKDGFTYQDALNEFSKERGDIPYGNEISGKTLEDFESRSNSILNSVKAGACLLGLLILMASFLGFIRMQIQLFWIRQREVALRTVVGGQLPSLVALFMTEISIVMLLVTGVAIAFDSIIRNLIEETIFQKISEEMYWNMDDFGIKTIIVAICMTIVCAIVVGIVIRKMRKSQTGLAMSMKPSTNKRIRTISLCIQMIISTLFISFTLMIVETFSGMKESMGIPENDDTIQENGLLVRETHESFLDARKCITQSMNVETIVPYSEIFWFRVKDENGNELTGPYYDVHGTTCLLQRNNELVKFFGIEVEELPHTARLEETIYVNRVMYNHIRQDQPEGTMEVEMFNRKWQVAGIINIMPYKDDDGRRCFAILNDQINDRNLLVIARKGQKQALKEEIRKQCPDALMYGVVINAKGKIDGSSSGYLKLLYKGSIFLSLICIINTITSLYSAISLDSRRRRKEVSLRKVNGATYIDIAKIFAKDYIIMLCICYVISLPVCVMAGYSFFESGTTDNITAGTLLTFVQTILIISTITFLTIWWKIKEIMYLKPVEGIGE